MAGNVGTKSGGDRLAEGGPGNFASPDPIGLFEPSKGRAPNPKSAPPSQGMELNLVGNYPIPTAWSNNPAKEAALAAKSTWFPSTEDFKAVAGGNVVVADTWEFLLQVFKAAKTIQRLNFFSHGKTGVISCEGTILPDGSNVNFSSKPDAEWGQIFGNPNAIAMPYSTDSGGNERWGTVGEKSSAKLKLNGTTLSLDDVRAKFTSDAVIWLYVCHAASDPMLAQQIANAFQVTVKGFNRAIVYCVQPGFPANRKHKLVVQTTAKPEDSCPKAVDNFHKLDNDPNITSRTPRKP